MKTSLRIMRPGQPSHFRVVEFKGESPTTDELHSVLDPILDTRNFEHVTVLYEGRAADMFVDEAGALKDLARNEEATQLYRNATMRRSPETDPEDLPFIHGPAALFEGRVWS